MLKLITPEATKLNNFKCGEVFCLSKASYNVHCCFCGLQVAFEEFLNHFEGQHSEKIEGTSYFEDPIKEEEIDDDEYKASLLENEDSLEMEKNPISLAEAELSNSEAESEAESNVSSQSQDDWKEEIGANSEDSDDEFKIEPNEKKRKEAAETHPCSKCDRKYKSRRALLNHLRINHNPNRSHNSQDSNISDSKDGLLEAKEEDDSPIDDSKVDDDVEADADTDAKDKKPEQLFPCGHCERIYRSKRALYNHVRINHNNNVPLKPRRKILEKNESEDTNGEGRNDANKEGPFPCPKCDRIYTNKRGLYNHLRLNHNATRPKPPPKRAHQCQLCGETFRAAPHLRGHMWKHTGIKCDICGKTFTQTGNLVRHKIRHTGVKAHQCQECDYSFYTDKELRAHMIRHTGIMPIICEICGRRCRDHGVLTAHMRRHTGERPAKCDVCGKRFFSFHDLNVHAVTHTSERPFSCDVCGSTFQLKKALRVHKKLHSSDRKHSCKICGKSFTQASGLNAHMRRHDTAVGKTSTNVDMQDISMLQQQITIELAGHQMMVPTDPTNNSVMTTKIEPHN